MNNPFEQITKRLDKIEKLLLKAIENSENRISVDKSNIEKIPIAEIFSRKMMSKPTFYKHLKAGNICVYKLGGRSYVDVNEFNNAFNKIKTEEWINR